MADEFVPGALTGQEGTGDTGGQSSESASTAGEPGITAQTGKEPSGEGLFDGMTPEQLHKSYKSLQAEFTKRNQGHSDIEGRFAAYGGVDQATQYLQFLATNPRFSDWVKAEQERQQFGIPTAEMDEETKKALSIVDQVTQRKIDEMVRSQVEPLTEAYREQTAAKAVEQMDRDYPDWREMQDKIEELSDNLPPEVQSAPTFKDFRNLYLQALAETGKFEEFARKSYEKNLQSKKKMSTERPGAAASSAPLKANSLLEAYEAAKRQLAR